MACPVPFSFLPKRVLILTSKLSICSRILPNTLFLGISTESAIGTKLPPGFECKSGSHSSAGIRKRGRLVLSQEPVPTPSDLTGLRICCWVGRTLSGPPSWILEEPLTSGHSIFQFNRGPLGEKGSYLEFPYIFPCFLFSVVLLLIAQLECFTNQ